MPERDPEKHDNEYLDFIRSQPCCVCHDPHSTVAHHPRLGMFNADSPGMAQKASDKWALPLCSRHHEELHRIGDRQYWASLGIDPFALAMHYQRRPR